MSTGSNTIIPHWYQRRVGNRYPVNVPMQWEPVLTGRRARKVTFSRTMTANMSLGGLGFESPTRRDVTHGSAVKVTLGDTACEAQVRSVRQGHLPGHTYYGIEFRDPDMINAVEDLISEHRRDEFEKASAARRSEDDRYFERLI